MFLFAKARIATGDEGVLPFPRDLHKISIFEARPEKNISTSHAGPDDESLLLKPALLTLTHAERITKEKSLFSRPVRFRGCVPYFLPPPIPLSSPSPSLARSRFIREFAISLAPRLHSRRRFALSSFASSHCFSLLPGGLIIDQFSSQLFSSFVTNWYNVVGKFDHYAFIFFFNRNRLSNKKL